MIFAFTSGKGRTCNTSVLLNLAGMLDSMMLLDIKSHIGKFDCIETTRNGRQDEVDGEKARTRGKRGYGQS